MGYGCLTCLQVIGNISEAFHLDFSNGSGRVSMREKLLDFIPNLVVNFNSASLCRKCVNIINAAYDFKQVTLESQKKILSFLEEASLTRDFVFEDVANWCRVRYPVPPVVSDSDVDMKSAPKLHIYDKETVQEFRPVAKNAPGLVFQHVNNIPLQSVNDLPTAVWTPPNEPLRDAINPVPPNNDAKAARGSRWEPANDNVPAESRWEPPPSVNEQQSDDAAPIFQSPPVTKADNATPVLKLKCRLCNYSCEENCMHAFHMILHENPYGPPYKCGRCPDELLSREQLLDHLARHTRENPYKCGVCFFTTNRYNRMKTHQDMHQLPFYCNICKKRFRFEKEMKSHLVEAHRSQLKCNLCKYQSINPILLQQHMRDHLLCRTCGQAFSTLEEVDVHCKAQGHKKKFVVYPSRWQ